MNSSFIEKFKFLLPSTLDIFFITILLFVIVYDSGAHILKDADTGFHIMTGRYIIDNLTFPRGDIFSYTVPGQEWIPFSWGTGVVFALIDSIAQLNGVVLISAIIILATLFISYCLLRHWQINFFLTVLSMLLLTCLTTVHWLARPHLFTIFFTMLTFYLLELGKDNKKYYYFIPFIMLLWVNFHPGFISGFFLLSLYFIGNILELLLSKNNDNKKALKDTLKYIFITGIGSLVLTLINPYGYKLYFYIYKTLTSSWIVNATREYYSPNFHGTLAIIVYAITLLIIIIVSFNSKEKPLDLPKILVLLFWTHLSLFSIRNIAIFAVVASPCFALILQRYLDDNNKIKFLDKADTKFIKIESILKYHTWPLVLILLLFIISINGGYLFNNKILNCYFSNNYIPVKAMDYYIKHPIKGNMFNEDNWGGFIIYAYPKIKVFMDGRLDMYQQDFLGKYQQIVMTKDGWQEQLDTYNVKWILFSNNTVFHNILKNSPEWKIHYTDNLS
ncbi:MAG: hypothetical protein AB1782_11835, partial [Cyanobacteriota bacterium]